MEEKKLITFEWFQDEVCNEGCAYYDVFNRQCKNEYKNPCDTWNKLESPEVKAKIIPVR